MSPRAWFLRYRRRQLVAAIASTWGARDELANTEARLRAELKALDEAHAPAWSPLVEYKGGELVKHPDGRVYRVAGPADMPGARERVARSTRELYGHDAAVEAAISHERPAAPLWPWAVFASAVVLAAMFYLWELL
jgi:hypothetical protein